MAICRVKLLGGDVLSQKNKLTVILNGREYTLVSEQTAEYMQKVALCVDRKMQELSLIHILMSFIMEALTTIL